MDAVVAYDIDTTTPEGEHRLVKVARICEGFGVRVQYSVFACRLSSTAIARLELSLRSVIDPGHDRVHIYRFDGALAAARTTLGRQPEHEWGRPWVVRPRPRTPGDPGQDLPTRTEK